MENAVSALGADGATNAANMLSRNASEFGNEGGYEQMWAMKTFKYAETHFNLISSFDASRLRLTKFDDQIYRMFKRYFKNFKVDAINDASLKDEASKARWRPFCELFKDKVEDYNFGTLLRINCSGGYSEDNTILVTRIQFIAIEIARNRRGLNQCHHFSEKENKATEPETVKTDQKLKEVNHEILTMDKELNDKMILQNDKVESESS